MTEAPESTDGIGAVETAFEIVDGIQEMGKVGVSELATELDIPKSTVHAHLKTLEHTGHVLNDDGEYRLGLRFLERGAIVRQKLDLFEIAQPEVDELSRATGEVANLGYEERGQRVLLYTVEPERGIFDNAPVGQFTRMHWTALGKSLLAQQSDDRIDEIIDQYGLQRATPNTITDRDALFEEINAVRDRGYSIENEERREGIKSVAVPVGESGDDLDAGAISISGPKRRIGDTEIKPSLIDALRNAANVIELKYKHY